MIRSFLAPLSAIIAGVSAGAYAAPPTPYFIQFEPSATKLDRQSTDAMSEIFAKMEQSAELELHFCSLVDSGDLSMDRADALQIAFEARGIDAERITLSASCHPGLSVRGDEKVFSSRGLVLVGTAPDIENFISSSTLAYSDYVPDTGWEEDWGTFYEGWFGKHLLAMGEPSFETPSSIQGFRSRFRITAYPNSLPAYAVRIDEFSDGTFITRWTILDGAGGYRPGSLAAEGNRVLGGNDAATFQELLTKANLMARPMEEPKQKPEQGTISLCLHGTHWTFELLTAAGHHLLERDFCGTSDRTLEELRDFSHAVAGEELSEVRERIAKERFRD